MRARPIGAGQTIDREKGAGYLASVADRAGGPGSRPPRVPGSGRPSWATPPANEERANAVNVTDTSEGEGGEEARERRFVFSLCDLLMRGGLTRTRRRGGNGFCVGVHVARVVVRGEKWGPTWHGLNVGCSTLFGRGTWLPIDPEFVGLLLPRLERGSWLNALPSVVPGPG